MFIETFCKFCFQGNIYSQIELSGSQQVTFRNLSICAANIEEYVKDIKNWPIGSDKKFLYVNYDNEIRKDCDEIDVEDFRWKLLRSGWKCENYDGNPVFASASFLYSKIWVVVSLIMLMSTFGQL